ncbi:MAG: hypothetical protein HXX19_06780 [Rhodoferax sp.]|nr:hypothetical protein [Rhodoferax sp.]
MLQLLNWRLWAGLILVTLAAAGGWKCFKLGEQDGLQQLAAYKAEQVAQALAADQAARDKEHSMQSANQKVTANYETLKAATAVAVGALDADRMRLQDALTASDPTANPSARACADDATRTRAVVRSCAAALQKLAGYADGTENQLIGLQDYVRSVVAPKP